MAARKSSETKPKKQRWYKVMWQAYTYTRRIEPSVTWKMLAVFVVVLGLAVWLCTLMNSWFYMVFGVLMAFLGSLIMLTRRFTKAQYKDIEGRPGAARAVLGQVRTGSWSFEDEPVAMDPRSQELIFRGVGRAGVLLVSEGGPGRVTKLLENEKRRVTRLVPNAPVTLVLIGNEEGQVPIKKLNRHVTRLKPQLTKQQASEVARRLAALGGAKLPLPKGIDPTRARPDRKGLKGR